MVFHRRDAFVEDGDLLLFVQRRRGLVEVTVVAHLMALGDDPAADLGEAVDRVARGEEGRRDALLLQHVEQARNGDATAELAA